MKRYKAVAGPKNINVARGDIQSAFDTFADIINREAVDGWEYHSMENITITEKPRFMQQPVPMNYYMLIFVREEDGRAEALQPETLHAAPLYQEPAQQEPLYRGTLHSEPLYPEDEDEEPVCETVDGDAGDELSHRKVVYGDSAPVDVDVE